MKWFLILAGLLFAMLTGPFPAYLESVKAHDCHLLSDAQEFRLAEKELKCRKFYITAGMNVGGAVLACKNPLLEKCKRNKADARVPCQRPLMKKL